MALNTDYDIEKAFRAIEDELIASMIRNLDGHRAEETKEGFNWTQWQVEQIKALERYKAENKKKFKKSFSNINDSIDAMIYAARQAGGTEQEQKILRAIKKGLKASKVSQGTEGAFFKLNTRKLDALIKATKADFTRAEHSMLRMSEDKYRQIIFNAQVYANTGAGTYEKAVDMATRDFLKAGINCIEYANGSRHTVKDYARMAIQTASKRAYLTGEGEMRQSWGISTVIMNKRANLRHDERDGMRISIQFSPTRVVEYSMEEMGHVELAYATTVHKAQGSEFDVVLFPLLRSHARMLTRSLVYTAITRANDL